MATGHQTVITEHPRHGFRARCSCGWASEWADHRYAERAYTAAGRHEHNS